MEPSVPHCVRTEAPPTPLPETWARALANSIAAELRKGWRRHVTSRAITPTGSTRSRDYHPAGFIPGPTETVEILGETIYQRGLVEPIEALGVPWLMWELLQLDLAAELYRRDLMKHHEAVQAWLKARRPTGPAPAAFTVRRNRHGNVKGLTPNAPHNVASVFEAAVGVATITVPNPHDVEDYFAERLTVDYEALARLVNSQALVVDAVSA